MTKKPSQGVFDEWSIGHFSVWFLLGKTGLFNPISFLIANIAWEFWENTETGIQWWVDRGQTEYEGDSFLNSFTDILWGYAGFYLGSR